MPATEPQTPAADDAEESLPRLPQHCNVVGGQGIIRGHERNSEIPCLGHEQPVERITVMERQVPNRPHLRARDGDLMKAELGDDLWQVVRSPKLAAGALDRDLPTGMLPRRIVTSSPRSARATSFDNCVFASLMLIGSLTVLRLPPP